MKVWIALILNLTASTVLYSQSSTIFVWEASTAVNYSLGKDWSFNTSAAKRSLWLDNDLVGESEIEGRLAFVEVNQFATYQINPKLKTSLGYKYRWLDPTEGGRFFEHRITQQLAMIHRTRVIRLTSRLRSEQRFRNETFAQRLRYRFSIDFPLSGESLNAREFYLLASNEVTYEIQNARPNQWGNRLTSGLGYLFGPVIKIQLSFTYRSGNFTQQTLNRLFVETALFINVQSKS
jgi:hypothetical protein